MNRPLQHDRIVLAFNGSDSIIELLEQDIDMLYNARY